MPWVRADETRHGARPSGEMLRVGPRYDDFVEPAPVAKDRGVAQRRNAYTNFGCGAL